MMSIFKNLWKKVFEKDDMEMGFRVDTTQESTNEYYRRKKEEAIQRLGSRWTFHSDNHVRRKKMKRNFSRPGK
jgi:hypothetical protein